MHDYVQEIVDTVTRHYNDENFSTYTFIRPKLMPTEDFERICKWVGNRLDNNGVPVWVKTVFADTKPFMLVIVPDKSDYSLEEHDATI